MLLQRFDRTFPLTGVRNEMTRLFNDVFGDVSVAGVVDWLGDRAFPPVNVWEDDRTVYAEAELPGLKLDEIEVLVADNQLTIKGERTLVEKEGESLHRRERSYGRFERVLELPVEIDANKVDATLHDGVLTVTLPKSEVAKARKIDVKTG